MLEHPRAEAYNHKIDMFYLFICLSLSKESVFYFLKCFSDSSVGKEYICNAGDPGLIPGSGRSTGEGISYPLQYSWASLVAQLVQNLLATWETPV